MSRRAGIPVSKVKFFLPSWCSLSLFLLPVRPEGAAMDENGPVRCGDMGAYHRAALAEVL